MGAHSYWIGRALSIYRGETLTPVPAKHQRALNGDGPANMVSLARTTEAHRVKESDPARSRELLDAYFHDQNTDGWWCNGGSCEQGTGSPHGGMHLLALMVSLEIGDPRAVELAGKVARLLYLCSTPDLSYAGPGIRADDGAYNGFASEYDAWLRVVMGQPQRGAGGSVRALTGKSNSLVADQGDLTPGNAWQYLPALWLMGMPVQVVAIRKALDTEALPALRLPLTIYRWPGGHLAVMADPGPGKRNRYRTDGSSQARKEHDPEDVTTWVWCEYGKPGKHTYRSGISGDDSWGVPPPSPPAGARVVTIGRAA